MTEPGPDPASGRADTAGDVAAPVRAWHALRVRGRLLLAASLFVVLLVVLDRAGVAPASNVLVAFDVATLIYLAATSVVLGRAPPTKLRSRAMALDGGRWGVLAAAVAVSVVVLVALALELHGGGHPTPARVAIAAVSLLLAWLFVNTMFALHYAQEYYGGPHAARGGLAFPGRSEPDYWDFVYFAIVLGMTFQVSDVAITARRMRHLALAHSIIAFFFNVVIIALTVNVVAGSV
ncbi:MAG: DUF1345 domain-containing protein [Lysobacterales bacterium]